MKKSSFSVVFLFFVMVLCSCSSLSASEELKLGTLSPFPEVGYLAFTYEDYTSSGESEIFIGQPGSDKVLNLTDNPASDRQPIWAKNGTQIAFFSNRDGEWKEYIMDSDGSNVQLLSADFKSDLDWSPDGSKIAYASDSVNYMADIFIQNSDGTIEQLMDTPDYEGMPKWSPDGTRIAYICYNKQMICIVTLENREFQILQMNDDDSFFWQSNLSTRRGVDWVTIIDMDWYSKGEKIALILNYGASQDKQLCLLDVLTANMDCIVKGPEIESMAWSPTGEEIAYINRDLFVIDISNGTSTQLTDLPENVRISGIDWTSE